MRFDCTLFVILTSRRIYRHFFPQLEESEMQVQIFIFIIDYSDLLAVCLKYDLRQEKALNVY